MMARPLNRAGNEPVRRKRRGSLLAEVAMATVILMIAMSLTVKVLGWVALERRAAERRQRALMEVANVMERIAAYPFDEVTPELTRRITLSTTAGQSLPESDLSVDVTNSDPGAGRSAKRIAVRLRWKGRSGEWEAPVRLTSWLERRRPAS
jgi:Tfp pilus assembly protein PilV